VNTGSRCTAVNTAREHVRHFWRPVKTGHRDR